MRHYTELHTSGRQRYATCSCGWQGPMRDRGSEAAEDADEHVRLS